MHDDLAVGQLIFHDLQQVDDAVKKADFGEGKAEMVGGTLVGMPPTRGE